MHSICAGGVVLYHDMVLVIHQNQNSWSLPKGHCDEGEALETTARREIEEESGVSALQLIQKIGTYSRYKIGINGSDDIKELKEMTVFLYRALSPQIGSVESKSRPIWVHWKSVPTLLTHPKDREFYEIHMPLIHGHMAETIMQVATTVAAENTARMIADQLLGTGLVGCIQIEGPIQSHYVWKNQRETSQEWRLLIKCTQSNYPAVESAIQTLHPYELPEIIGTTIDSGFTPYLQWIK
jgi:periplasmic divalent cation tolerance protein